jgi:DNA end-binding protein Ku
MVAMTERQLLSSGRMARALWTGSLSFGLVSIPVEIHTAVKDKGPRFRMLRKKDKSPIHFQRVAERDGEVVEWEQIVKGYEYSKGHFVVLTAEDFEKAALKKDRIIDILDFVSAEAIDDRFFDKPYYLLPAKGGDKAYALLREAIKESGQIGVAKFVLRTKQRLAAIEAIGDALVLSTMRFEDELADLEDYSFPASKGVQRRDLQMAQRLIKEFSSEWDPAKYTDDYRDNIKKVIAAKQKDTEADLDPEADPQSAQVVDLMERLRKSLGTKRADTAKVRKAKGTSKATKTKVRRPRRRAA